MRGDAARRLILREAATGYFGVRAPQQPGSGRRRVDSCPALLDSAIVRSTAQSRLVKNMRYGILRRTRRLFEAVRGLCGAMVCTAALAQSAPATGTLPPGHPAGAPKPSVATAPAKRIDINSASATELKRVPGIGDAEAKKIIAGRPWLTKVDLVNKGVLPEGVYVALRDHIVALQPAKTVSSK
jgi:DNA uptake protein ComE-like DNA-binding protein